jgi:hypothetical protein
MPHTFELTYGAYLIIVPFLVQAIHGYSCHQKEHAWKVWIPQGLEGSAPALTAIFDETPNPQWIWGFLLFGSLYIFPCCVYICNIYRN